MRLSHAQAFQLRKLSRLCNYYYLKREIEKKKKTQKNQKNNTNGQDSQSARAQPASTKTGDPCSEDLYFFLFQNQNLAFTRVSSALSSPRSRGGRHPASARPHPSPHPVGVENPQDVPARGQPGRSPVPATGPALPGALAGKGPGTIIPRNRHSTPSKRMIAGKK
jgi:hypothetical protein